MNITMAPLRIDSHNASKLLPVRDEGEYLTWVYWGIYLNNECLSYTSSKDLAEKTKLWIEKWLSNRH